MRLEPHSLTVGSRLSLTWVRQVWDGLRRRTVVAGRGLRARYTPNGTIVELTGSTVASRAAETPDDGVSINIREADAEAQVPRARQIKDFFAPTAETDTLADMLDVDADSGDVRAAAAADGVLLLARRVSDDGASLVYLPIGDPPMPELGNANPNDPCNNHPGGTENVPVGAPPAGVPVWTGGGGSSGGVAADDPTRVPSCH